MFLPDPPPPSAPAALKLPVAVIGGGVTGLAAAFRLAQSGVAVRLFERSNRLGGVVGSEKHSDGWLIESGPNSFQLGDKKVAALLKELALDTEIVEANAAAKKRFIAKGGQPVPVPASPGQFFSTPLFKFGSKLKIATEAFSRRRIRPVDVSLATLVRDHFGDEIVDYALNPFVSGVYAGNPDLLSARHSFPSVWESEQTHGSLLRGLIAQAKRRRQQGHPKSKIISFRNGLNTLPAALAAKLPEGSIELESQILSIIPAKHGAPWLVRWERGGVARAESFASVLLALPAHALAGLNFGPTAASPFSDLAGIVYPPVSSLFLGYKRDQIAHPLDGFGMLIPAVEKSRMLGVLFSSSLFPGRSPDGHVALTVMVGGSLQPALTELGGEELLRTIEPELRSFLGISGSPVFMRQKAWRRAIPQYNLGYERFLERIESIEHTFSDLYVGGQVRDGIALPSCLLAGLRLAERALKA